MIGATIATPADVIKTRLQVKPQPGDPVYTGISDCFKQILGMSKIIPSFASFTGAYSFLLQPRKAQQPFSREWCLVVSSSLHCSASPLWSMSFRRSSSSREEINPRCNIFHLFSAKSFSVEFPSVSFLKQSSEQSFGA